MNSRRLFVTFVLALGLLGGLSARAQNNTCEEGEYPDLIIGEIPDRVRYGVVGDITAFAIGNNTCNQGTCYANWLANVPEHPLFGQNMYRLKNDRFEQIGQSWLKHGFTALQGTLCSTACLPSASDHLGVNCSDPYSASLNGSQARLGPKFEVNPDTGVYPYPATDGANTGDAIYKRLQVHNSDLDPALNAGAAYFVEIQIVTHDDTSGKNNGNNASYRKVNVTGSAGVFDIVMNSSIGTTQPTKLAVEAWKAVDSSVVVTNISAGGRVIVAAKATALGGGTWHYEYAVQNLNSHRAIRSFRVPLPEGAVVTNVGFHDVDYHSGEPFVGTDWPGTVDAGAVTWQTDTFASNPNANALRWGTLYNFRFDANVAPVTDDVRLGLFRPGLPGESKASTLTPNPCLVNGVCTGSETCINCPADCGGQSPNEVVCDDGRDDDCDGQTDCLDVECCTSVACVGSDLDHDGYAGCDCNDSNVEVWATPGEVREFALTKGGGSVTNISWLAPTAPGGAAAAVVYEVVRSATPGDFSSASCLTAMAPGVTTTTDATDPGTGGLLFYLVRATNTCPSDGTLGARSNGTPRTGRSCP